MSVFDGDGLISVYSRAQAIEDRVLVDVTEAASEAGFSIPVAVTRTVWEDCVRWDQPRWQDEPGRLWDVVWMARCASLRRPDDDRVSFQMLRVPNNPDARVARRVSLTVHVGPGDDAEPVVTIMFPDEL